MSGDKSDKNKSVSQEEFDRALDSITGGPKRKGDISGPRRDIGPRPEEDVPLGPRRDIGPRREEDVPLGPRRDIGPRSRI